MKKFGDFICKHKVAVFAISIILLILSIFGIKATKINYDILVYLPENIETVNGQNILTNDFNMGAFSITIIDNMNAKDVLKLENQIKEVKGVNKVITAYDLTGTSIPLEMLPNDIIGKIKKDNSTLMFITYEGGTSSESTLNAIKEIKTLTKDSCKISGMSAMVLDTMNLSEKEITIYIIIAVLCCITVLELSLDSYLVPILLLGNIGAAIIFNLGSNIIFGEISYITKALVAVLQLGVTTDFSIFLYHAYENKKKETGNINDAMSEAISETSSAVTGSALTTIAGFLVLCTMSLTLGKDLGLVMAKGVFLGIVCVLTLFPSLLLLCDKAIEKTKHRSLEIKFDKLNKFVIKHHIAIFIIFLILLIPTYLGYSKVNVYYKIDESLPRTLDSIVANNELKEKFDIVSSEIVLIDKDIKPDEVQNMINEINNIDGIDLTLSFTTLKQLGITDVMLPKEVLSTFESGKYQLMLINSDYDIATDELNNQITEVNKIIKKYDKNAILAGEGPLTKDLINTSDTDFNNVNSSSIICILIIMLIVLKSYTLPLLLISTIEFAIFVNMSISYFGGDILPFVAPIVLGTIQLGATIDYAILMTTTYLKNRKDGLSSKEAMLKTTNYCANSIFVSGMCFFAATFGVGLYSKLEMVGSLCTLISRGAVISMIVVLTVLPSILIIFDKIICKTTYGMKELKNMKNKSCKIATIIMILTISISALPVYALSKNETVYAKLNSDGSSKYLLINEHLINNEQLESIQDESALKNILNINNDNTFTSNNNYLTWNAKGKDIFYQGQLEKELPIKLEITYNLNGEDVALKDIIGKSGKVTIKLKYTNLDKHIVSINGLKEEMYTPFVITAGTIISDENNSNITVENGKVINNGSSNIIVGIATPGLYESMKIDKFKNMNTITISYDTKKFELGSIYSVATPKLIESADLNIFNKINTVYASVDKLQSSIDELEKGSQDLLDGSNLLNSNVTLLSEKLKYLNENMKLINEGGIALDDGIDEILTNLYGIKAIETSKESILKINQMKELMLKNTTTINTLTTQISSIKDIYIENNLKDKTLDELKDNKELQNIKTSYENTTSLVQLLQANNSALEESLKTFESTSTSINDLIKTLEYIKGKTSYLEENITKVTEGVSAMDEKGSDLVAGVEELNKGIAYLNEGITKFNDEGINKVSGLVNNNLKKTTSRLEALINLGNNYNSFDDNNNIETSTKFVMVVDSVKAPTPKKDTVKEVKKESFWDRIINLFK